VSAADLLLTGARVLTPDDDLDGAWVAVASGRIESVGRAAPPPAAETVDLHGRLLVPGFLDLHVHGGGGAHFMGGDPAACVEAARFHAAHGTTGLLATTLSAPPAGLEAAVRAVAAAMTGEPLILGIHLEGPWLNRERRGAHQAEHLRAPDRGELRTLVAASGQTVRLVSLAPELPGALELIAEVAAAGAMPALAHTDATHAQAEAAIRAGARHAVHVFNGMRPLHHREPGVLGAVLDHPEVTCEVIADGHHVHPAVVRLLHRAKGAGGTVLVTDAMEAAGLPGGRYRLGGTPVEVTGGRAETPDGRLAGSTLTMDAAVRNAHRWLGVPLGAALALATTTPARILGRGDRKGRIAPGFDADLAVLDAELQPVATLIAGRWANRS
jgi:N-acetylglucosamine-6-phosphate deacetylase